jgi:hypothetical protein
MILQRGGTLCRGIAAVTDVLTWECVIAAPDLGHMTYNDFTINTTCIPVNKTVMAQVPVQNYSDGLNTKIQLDGNYSQQPYSTWIDK